MSRSRGLSCPRRVPAQRRRSWVAVVAGALLAGACQLGIPDSTMAVGRALAAQPTATQGGGAVNVVNAACERPPALRLAVVPKGQANLQPELYAPLLQLVQQRAGVPAQLVPVASYGAVVEGLLAGTLDMAELGPASYAMLQQRSGGQGFAPFAVLSNQRDQPTRYHALLVVRASSVATTLQALHGSRLALVDPASTSGALLPRQALQQRTGYPVEQFFRRVAYSGTHDRALDAVLSGQADVAAVSSNRLQARLAQGSIQPDQLRVLWQSPALAPDPFVLRTALCAPLQQALRLAFLTPSPALQPLLQAQGAAAVLPAHAQDYAELPALLGWVK